MTKEEVKAWALDNGFTERPDGRLATDHDGTVVAIEFTGRNVRVLQTLGDKHRTIISAHPGHAHVNEFGVLEGLGLSASFLTSSHGKTDAVPPPWMPQGYLDAIGWTGLPATDHGAPKGP